jgi:hypothetical protein
LEKLLKKIYIVDNYNNEVRPFDEGDQTKVETELKLLQIDLDEKYQQLVFIYLLIQIYNSYYLILKFILTLLKRFQQFG